ncbi:hypothetical protein SARC_02738 [Sphaeroforma arctica JP610]|uniref:Uncharacterized protein n=1 Tax=Sphaeroforma arctica JP610 TaxID=667725 RepID=A0A0L0G7S2_9EUKA|nr:hypothetical protein SARC_02738 [Sphaeroforma arctica JP610]KNC85045.1 hypothetical protein SARC_02738 [Sphaeroforma arctica JP610]|eukprot:XP_014158947.1 hypothetical protein SARC_02738 [Sphaeroforma arctica JP610]
MGRRVVKRLIFKYKYEVFQTFLIIICTYIAETISLPTMLTKPQILTNLTLEATKLHTPQLSANFSLENIKHPPQSHRRRRSSVRQRSLWYTKCNEFTPEKLVHSITPTVTVLHNRLPDVRDASTSLRLRARQETATNTVSRQGMFKHNIEHFALSRTRQLLLEDEYAYCHSKGTPPRQICGHQSLPHAFREKRPEIVDLELFLYDSDEETESTEDEDIMMYDSIDDQDDYADASTPRIQVSPEINAREETRICTSPDVNMSTGELCEEHRISSGSDSGMDLDGHSDDDSLHDHDIDTTDECTDSDDSAELECTSLRRLKSQSQGYTLDMHRNKKSIYTLDGVQPQACQLAGDRDEGFGERSSWETVITHSSDVRTLKNDRISAWVDVCKYA